MSNYGISKIQKSSKNCFKWDEPILMGKKETETDIDTRILGGYNASVGEFRWDFKIIEMDLSPDVLQL
jgi:hypothetical protein